jgi:hypothetical protein
MLAQQIEEGLLLIVRQIVDAEFSGECRAHTVQSETARSLNGTAERGPMFNLTRNRPMQEMRFLPRRIGATTRGAPRL